MTTYTSELWSLILPSGWVSENEADYVTLYHPDGVGTLEISATEHDQNVSADFLEELAAEHLEAGAKPSDLKCGPFKGFEISYDDDGEYWQEWYLRAGKVLIFATYNCSVDDEGLEDDTITTILRSLKQGAA